MISSSHQMVRSSVSSAFQAHSAAKRLVNADYRQQVGQATAGHEQHIRDIRLDCDNDTVLLVVEQQGGIACHTGRHHCFFQQHDHNVWKTVEPVLRDADEIYGKK